MPQCREIPTSRSGDGNGSFDLTFSVDGTIDDIEAEGIAAGKAPIAFRGLPRFPIPQMRSAARGIFEFTYTYKSDQSDDERETEPQGELPTIGKFSTKPVGGTQHITQCLYQTGFASGVRTQDIETSRVIGLHKDGVHGCDIDQPGEIITLEKLWLPAAVSGEYIGKVQKLKGKTNLNPYTMRWANKGTRYELQYETGELRFLGCEWSTSLTPRGITAWTSIYQWLHVENRRNVEFTSDSQPIRVTYIGGHDYVWAYYERSQLTGDIKATLEKPRAVFVSTVYSSANYVDQLGF